MDTNIESLPQKEVFYDYCIEHETPSSEFQLNYGEDLKLIKKEFAGMDKTIINKGGLVHASDKNDSYFAIVLFHTDKYHTMGGIERFLNHHFAQYSYSKIDFLTHTSKIIDRYQLNGFPEMIMKDFEFKKMLQ